MSFKAKVLISFLVLFAISHLQYFTEEFTYSNKGLVNAKNEEEHVVIPDTPLILDVTLKRRYLDGEVSEERVQETIWALEDFWAKYESWQLVDIDEENIVFEQSVDDISPLLKVNGFFGITDDGTLSIFNGDPGQSEIIQSFFQIDIKKLEGKKRMELKRGIPVQSKEVYTEVLEAMRQYSIESDSENTKKTSPAI
ncbi:intercompartmental signaling factor BofC [Bacillus niameyensis]|uniref:intercompartmental signaling factor BofC n=1 Tax=Bacillus niameyensis TaxID=1522308 RepID=UPI000781EE7C|nr:intercompartmental signaling factor BofC [Bacillus niameyensis]